MGYLYQLEKPMTKKQIILAYPQDARVRVLHRDHTVHQPLYEPKIRKKISPLIMVRVGRSQLFFGQDGRGQGGMKIKPSRPQPLLTKTLLLKCLIME